MLSPRPNLSTELSSVLKRPPLTNEQVQKFLYDQKREPSVRHISTICRPGDVGLNQEWQSLIPGDDPFEVEEMEGYAIGRSHLTIMLARANMDSLEIKWYGLPDGNFWLETGNEIHGVCNRYNIDMMSDPQFLREQLDAVRLYSRFHALLEWKKNCITFSIPNFWPRNTMRIAEILAESVRPLQHGLDSRLPYAQR